MSDYKDEDEETRELAWLAGAELPPAASGEDGDGGRSGALARGGASGPPTSLAAALASGCVVPPRGRPHGECGGGGGHLAPVARMAADARFHALPLCECDRLRRLLPCLLRLDGSANRSREVEHLADVHAGHRGFTKQSLYRAYYLWKGAGRDWTALIDRARVPEVRPEKAGKEREEFAQFFAALAESFQRKSAAAIRALYRRWREGESIPGYGTWREWWAREYPGATVPVEAPIPRGWSRVSLYALLPSRRSLLLARQGFGKALLEGPHVRRTTRGCGAMQYVVFDDFMLDWLCYLPRQMDAGGGRLIKPGVYRMAGMAAMDVASRKVLSAVLRVMARDTEDVRLVVGQADLGQLAAQIFTEHGIPQSGTTLLVENATAAVSTDTERMLHSVFGGVVRVSRSGLIDSKLLASGYREGGGKFWHKGWIESWFNSLHNEAADARGQVGRRRDLAPGKHLAEKREAERLLRGAAKAGVDAEELVMPVESFAEASERFFDCLSRLNARTDHAIADLPLVDEQQGPDGAWHILRGAAFLVPGQQPILRQRRRSPDEHFAALRSAARFAMVEPQQLAPLLSAPREVTVRGGMIRFSAGGEMLEFFSSRPPFARLLADGAKYRAHWCEAARGEVFLFCPEDGRYLGSVPRWESIPMGDSAAMAAAGREVRRANDAMADEYRVRHSAEQSALVRSRAHNAAMLDSRGKGAASKPRNTGSAATGDDSNLSPENPTEYETTEIMDLRGGDGPEPPPTPRALPPPGPAPIDFSDLL